MNQGSLKPLNYPPGTINTGGAITNALQKISGFMSWKVIVIIFVGILLVCLGYYAYKNYTDGKTAFNANREHMPKDLNSNKEATLMLFYVDWCPHCVKAKPEWESLKAEYDGKSINGYTLSFVEYNCTTETDEISQMIDKYNIEGYPTIKLLKDNQVIEYDAKPTKETMVQFLTTVL